MDVKVWKSGTLTVNSAGTGFDDNLIDTFDTSGNCFTTNINGEILKIVVNFTSSDTNAVLTLVTRDSPTETVAEITNWTTDVTFYPLVEGKTYANGTAAASNKTNVFQRFVISGSLQISCTAATDNDTVVVKVYWR